MEMPRQLRLALMRPRITGTTGITERGAQAHRLTCGKLACLLAGVKRVRFFCCLWLFCWQAVYAQVSAPPERSQCAFVHPGTLHAQADLDRMRDKVAAGVQPWTSSWELLVASPWAQLSHQPRPQAVICRGGGCARIGLPENYILLARDIAAAYGCALRWDVSGDLAYADKAVEILNAWAAVLQQVTGDSNVSLAAGIYGWQFAVVGDLMLN